MSNTNEIISKELLNILACPECKADIELTKYKIDNKEKNGLRCIKCKRIYPIKEGIPVMLVEEAIIRD